MLLDSGKAPLTVPVTEAKNIAFSFPNEDVDSLHLDSQQSQDILSAALEYTARGIPVFPCISSGENAKHPFTSNGFKNASIDPAQIRAWWAQWPDAMIGMPTGRASGFWVLDIDAPKAEGEKNGFVSYKSLTCFNNPTPADHANQTTPSGGQHIFFKYTTPIRNSVEKIGPKIDVRGDGGYVIMAPSVIHGVGQYTSAEGFLDDVPEAPDWLIALATDDKKPKKDSDGYLRHLPPGGAGAVSMYGLKALKEECANLATTPFGQQNETLNTVSFRIGQLVGGGHMSRMVAYEFLLSAIQGWENLDLRKSSDTINRALDAGAEEPRGPEPIASFDVPLDTPKEKIPLPTEDSLATMFTARYEGQFVYCHDTGAWFHWNGVHWQKDKMRYPLHLMRELCREMNHDGKPVLGKLVTASGSLKFAAGDPRMAVTSEIWDADPWLIGTPGGVVDLRTGTLSPGNPNQYITKLAGVAPAESADCPLWYRFLGDATRGDAELQRFMRQIAGYYLTGITREHALFFIYGPGGNGKSVFLNILNATLADYATTSALTTFTASHSDQHPTDLAMLRGARLVSVSETEEGRAWAESRIKQLTGGDKITARFMRQDFFEYIPQFKLLIVGNHQPTLRNVDNAARRRFNIIPFVHQPLQPDQELEKKLMRELPAIFRWAIEGCLDWQANGLVRPQSVIAATQEYFDSQDLFGRWLEEHCVRGAKEWTETKILYQSWSAYAKLNGEEVCGEKQFGPMLGRAGFLPSKASNKHGWKGIALLRQEEWQDSYDR
jgi:P4 family phage/plasmid primase-like protien